MKTSTFILSILAVAFTYQAHGALLVTNGDFEAFSNETTTGAAANKDLITDWYEANHTALDGSAATAEQVLLEDGNRPTDANGTHWGHFIDRTESGIGLSSIYQQVGVWSTGDGVAYELTAELGDRSNRDFAPLTFEFFAVSPVDAIDAPADGTAFGDAFASAVSLASFSSADPFVSGEAGSVGTALFSQDFVLTGVTDGSEIWLVITQEDQNNFSSHSLIDDIEIVPEPATIAMLLMGLGMVFVIIRKRSC